MQDDVGAFEYLTAGIALLGLVLAVLSIAWQVFSWRLAGSRVSVELGQAFGVGDFVPMWSVTARNRGRLGVEVTHWGFQLPTRETIAPTMGSRWHGPSMPVTLGAGHSETWYMDLDALIETLRSAGRLGEPVRGFVILGTGDKKLSKQSPPVR